MKMLSTLLWTLAAVIIGYALIVVMLYIFQTNLIFYPVSELPYKPDLVGLGYEDINFTSEDGVTLHGWFIPHQNPRGTILFQHGNAGNISGRLETLKMLHQIGLNVFIYDYRGYGQSEGEPSEEGTYKDAMAAWRYLVEERGISPRRIVLMGRSLGGAVTSWLATRVSSAGVILESTFTSAADLAADLYPLFPARQLIKYEYSNKERLQDINVPILLAHSPEDDLVPYEHGRKLYKIANDPKSFLKMKGDHGNGFLDTGEPYIRAIDDFVSKVLEGQKVKRE